jgi:hypothetical protein
MKWINIKKELPKPSVHVMLWHPLFGYHEGFFYSRRSENIVTFKLLDEIGNRTVALNWHCYWYWMEKPE